MRTKALSRKLVATAAVGLVFGGASIAAAAVVPSTGSSHSLAVDETTTVAPDDSTTTVAPDESTTTSHRRRVDDHDRARRVDDHHRRRVDDHDGSTTTTTAVPTTAPCNHGQDVSDVAHSAPRGHDAGPGAHGKAVSTVAHEKCADHHDDDSTAGDTIPATRSPAPTSPASTSPATTSPAGKTTTDRAVAFANRGSSGSLTAPRGLHRLLGIPLGR